MQGRRHEILARQDRHTATAEVGLAGLTYDGGLVYVRSTKLKTSYFK